jgi:DNA modification methylase
LPVDKLLKHPKNPNKHPKDQIKRLSQIIEYQGWTYPINVSNLSGYINCGHGRLEAAKLKKWTEVPVKFIDFENQDQEYAAMVSDNAIAEWADLDFSFINDEIAELGPDFDIEMLGLLNFEIDKLDPVEGQCDDDHVPENVDTRAKPGDVWQLGEHRLMCGDSTDVLAVEKLMNGEKADMVFTDPPYGVNYSGGHFHSKDVKIQRKRKKLVNDHSEDIYRDVLPVLVQFVDGPIYTWYAASKEKSLYNMIAELGEYHAMIVWHKTNATYAAMNAQYKQRHEPCVYWKPKGSKLRWCGPTNEATVWEIKRDAQNNFYPTQKPVELAERAILNHSAKSCLDLFGGSGSTLIACEKTNRKCYMMELDPHYCDVILSRWEKYTGKLAERIQNG